MGSSFERSLLGYLEQIENEIDAKMEKAFENAMHRVEMELQELMEKETVQNFYSGYHPHIYIRTNQLHKAISLTVDNTSAGDFFSFAVYPFYDESDMDHSVYKIKVFYQPKKNKKAHGPRREYIATVKLKNKPDEEEIMEMTLGEGYHPRVGTAGTRAPIWTQDDEGVFVDALTEYINDNFRNIFNEEYNKI